MFIILFVPALRGVFNLVPLPVDHVFEIIVLVFAPIVIVEAMKLIGINTTKDDV